MGFYDRPYAHRDSGRPSVVGSMRMWSITVWLIVINVAVYIVNQISGDRLAVWGYFSADTAIYHLQIWPFSTFQFLHANPSHIFFNMLALYFFGPLVEGYLGSRRYLAFYLLCGMAGAAMYLLLWKLGVLSDGAQTPLVGASAGIFGVLVAGAKIAPDAKVMLLIPPIPMRLKVLAWVMLGLAVLVVFSNGQNAGGEAAHLGGAAPGFALISRPEWLNVFARWPRRRPPRRWRA